MSDQLVISIPWNLTGFRYYQQGARNKYGCQPNLDLRQWHCFRREVEEWIEENIRQKSRLRLRLGKLATDPISSSPRNLVYFGIAADLVFFKLKWL
jgi:hypothetical protein